MNINAGGVDFQAGHNTHVDNVESRFGTGNDLKIYHNGSVNLIQGANSKNIYIQGDDVAILNQAGNQTSLWCNSGGSVDLMHNNVKQLETTENGIYLPKGVIRGLGSGTKAIIGGALNPSQDVTWNFSFSTNHAGYNNGYVFNVRFVLNHWNVGGSYKYIESMTGGRGNVTGMERVDLINNVGTASSGWTNSHLDYSVALTGGSKNGSGAS